MRLKLMVGSRVKHQGIEDYAVIEIDGKRVIFENDRHIIKCNLEDIEYDEIDSFFYLPVQEQRKGIAIDGY